MKRQYDPVFIKALNKVDVRIRKSFKERIAIFAKNPNDPQLNNHALQEPYEGLRSIDINNDYRAVYEEIHEADGKIAYFTTLGTHKELYRQSDENLG